MGDMFLRKILRFCPCAGEFLAHVQNLPLLSLCRIVSRLYSDRVAIAVDFRCMLRSVVIVLFLSYCLTFMMRSGSDARPQEIISTVEFHDLNLGVLSLLSSYV